MPTLYTFKDTDAIAIGLADFIKKACDSAIDRHDKFTIGLSGGSLPKTLGKALVPLPEGTFDYSKWYILYSKHYLQKGKYSSQMNERCHLIATTQISSYATITCSQKSTFHPRTSTPSMRNY